MMQRFKVAAVATLAAISLIATPLVSATEMPVEPERTISTSGVGIVTVEPDTARFSVGMEARHETLKPAQDEVTNEANAITAMLIEAGIDEKDIVTTSYQVTPENKYDRNGNFVEIEAYVVTMSISITVRDLDKVGELLDQSVTLGADYVSNIQFSVSDPSPHIQEARKMAIADAKQKAEDYATGSDSTITGLFTLWESSSPAPTARDGSYTEDQSAPMSVDMEVARESNPVEVSAGSTTIVVRIETTWTIEPNSNLIQPESTPAN